ncbi:unnamed protein product [Orchesella dallaii]|uniref:Ubiquinone biosynthesis O-methyltransferase, mitochondrial n=1 Tax=Orchesella dallaii TaxID=48710 RepID=A0ABP1S5M1_9HEXA
MFSKTTLLLSSSIICGCQRRRFSLIKFAGRYYHCNSVSLRLSGSQARVKASRAHNGLSEKYFGKSYRAFSSQTADTTSGSVRPEEIDKFEKMSSSWWDQSEGGQMKELHSMNRLRVPFIRDGLLQKTGSRTEVPNPLEGLTILDVGCGGGVLCEPLGRLGAKVKGIDPGKGNIFTATTHLSEELRDNISYECTSIEDFATKYKENGYDAVVMSEVVEHVEKPEDFIRIGSSLLKPGGSLFLTTLNRTMESWMGAILAWEYLLRRLPIGTHEWRRFLTPEEIARILKSSKAYSSVKSFLTFLKKSYSKVL